MGLRQDKVSQDRAGVSGPLLDRSDMHVEVLSGSRDMLIDRSTSVGESSVQVQERVEATRARQHQHGGCANAVRNIKQIEETCRLDEEGQRLLEQAINRLEFSARAYYWILKLARTITDMAAEETIRPAHVTEAIQYRCLDRRSRLLSRQIRDK
jgi:magnesium chelatase family protein